MIKLRISYENEKEKLKISELINIASKLGAIQKISKECKGDKYNQIYVNMNIKNIF